MLRFSIQLIFLYVYYTIVPGNSRVEFNRIFFGCLGNDETLQMMCRVNDLELGVYIFHKNIELAYCVAFPINTCFNTTGYISMLSSSVVIYTIDSRQLTILNGSWTCRNGAGEKNENSSLEVFSSKCRPSLLLLPGHIEKDNAEYGIVLLVVPLVVFSITVIILHCCKISGKKYQNEHNDSTKWLLEKVSCLWQCKKTEQTCNERSKIVYKSLWCFSLFGVYCTSVVVFYYCEMSTDVRIGLLVFFTFIGTGVAIFIPVLWQSRGSIGDTVDGHRGGGSSQESTGTRMIGDTVDEHRGGGSPQERTRTEELETVVAPGVTMAMLKLPGNKTDRKPLLIKPSQAWAALITVTIRGNKAVKRYGNLHLNCSSETIPSRKAADIQINGISHTSLAWLNEECYSRDIGKKCSPNICKCSGSGTWFSYIYKVVQPESNLSISCSMSFGKAGSITDSIIVRIIEFSDPEIRIDPPMPITAGSTVTLTCILVKTNEDIYFKWDCIEHKIVIGTKVRQNNITFSTLIIRNLNLTHDNKTCTCSVHVENITSKYSFQISISRKPVLETEEELKCNGSSLPTMTCLIRTDLQSYGFHAWLHRYNDVLVRTLNGSMLDSQSILQLRSCSYEDAGEYTCVAWNIYDGNYYTANKTVTLHVNVPPVIIASRTFKERRTIFSLIFYSKTKTMCIWQQPNQSLINSKQAMQTKDTRTIDVQFYNVTIACEVYEANLSVSLPTEKYEVILQNSFGESRYCFDRGIVKSKEVTSSFNLWILIVGLISVGTFTLTAVGTIILAKGRQCNNVIHIVGPHERCPTIPIYHSAPALPDVPHVYDTPEAGYLEVVNDTYEQYDYSENKEEEPQDGMTINKEEL